MTWQRRLPPALCNDQMPPAEIQGLGAAPPGGVTWTRTLGAPPLGSQISRKLGVRSSGRIRQLRLWRAPDVVSRKLAWQRERRLFPAGTTTLAGACAVLRKATN